MPVVLTEPGVVAPRPAAPRTVYRGRPRNHPLVLVVAAVFAVVAGLNWASQLPAAADLARADAIGDVTQALLMPLLAALLVLRTAWPRTRLVRLTLLGLGLSWLGDTLPRFVGDDAAFLVMVGCFLLAQLAYAAAFAPYARRAAWWRRPWLLAPYALAYAGLVWACAPGAGALLVPVLLYGLCLVTMAVLATGVDARAGIGGAVFLVSDGLIALDAFVPGLEVSGAAVMVTYVVGQVLLVGGVLRADARRGSGRSEA